MEANKTYIQFVEEVKQQILQSRYQAAKLVNKELLRLYFNIGKMIFEKAQKEKWGSSIIDNLSKDVQAELPGLRGFSSKNLRNMRLFFDTYERAEFWQLATAKIKAGQIKQIGQSPNAKLKTFNDEAFFALSFTHHILLLNKCKNLDERFFYMQQAASNYWTVHLLQHHIESDLYHQKGKLPNNFKVTLPQTLAAHALDAFKDEHLLDFININPEDMNAYWNRK